MRLIQAGVSRWAQDQVVLGLAAPSVSEQQRLVKAVVDERFGLGVLTDYLADENVENIDVNGCDQIWITYADGSKVAGPPIANSDEELIEKIRLWAIHGGMTAREFSASSPLLNSTLGDNIRVSAVMSVSTRPHLSLRRHGLKDVTLTQLRHLGSIDHRLQSFLAAAVRARKNIVVTGGVNAGKTTMLRALAAEIPPDERIATLESEYELYFHQLPDRHRDVVPLESRAANSEGHGAITLMDLIPQSLRMNIMRVVVGEVRSTEIIPMLEAMNMGQEGSLTTIHANSPQEIFNRILILALRGGLSMPPETVHLLTGMALDFVVHMRRDRRTNQRYVSEVMEVMEPADTILPAHNLIYRPGPDGRAVPATTPQCLGELIAAGFDASALEMWPPVYQLPAGRS